MKGLGFIMYQLNFIDMIKQDQLGNGTYTLENENDLHLTFKIKTVKEGNLKGKRVVYLMTGSDNENDYTGFGILNGSGFTSWGERMNKTGNLRIKKRNPKTGEYLTVSQLAACVQLLLTYGKFGTLDGARGKVEFRAMNGKFYRIWISSSCMVCNRKLTHPESVKRGIGPECIKKV